MNQFQPTPELPLITSRPNVIIGEPHPFTRRSFCRSLALSAGALGLGSVELVWAGSDSAKTKCETKVLWDFDGCLEDRFMSRVTTYVYNGNVYVWILLPGYKTHIVKAPLDGGKVEMFPLMPGHVTGDDPHRYYRIVADLEGYIHVVGDMHSSKYVKHWVSKRPEDISEFVFTSDQGENKRPQGRGVTYPKLFRSPDGVLYHLIRCDEPVWGICISVMNTKTQTWTMLGADVPADELHDSRAKKKTKGKPLTAWEDNGEGGYFSYTQPHANIKWDKNKRMHVVFGLLNENTPSAHGRHTGSAVLYAYSDDGGKTFCRGGGSQIQLPMRAEAGPHQADVVYSRHDGPPPWVDLLPRIHIDDKGRPVVGALDHKTGLHNFVLEKGKWTELVKSPSSSTSNQTANPNDEDEDDDSEDVDVSKLDLPYYPHNLDKGYLRETGDLVYTVLPGKKPLHGGKPKYNRILIMISKPVKAKA